MGVYLNGKIVSPSVLNSTRSSGVASVNGKTGNVTLGAEDVSAIPASTNAIKTAYINALAVTNEKIANKAITSEKISDLAIVTDKIADSSVTAEKLYKGDYIAADSLQAAINSALEQAKESGEFSGTSGKDGTPGVVVSSTEPTDESHPVWINPNGDASSLPWVPSPDSAAVGQVLVVKTVDDNGKPLTWETKNISDLVSNGNGVSY